MTYKWSCNFTWPKHVLKYSAEIIDIKWIQWVYVKLQKSVFFDT